MSTTDSATDSASKIYSPYIYKHLESREHIRLITLHPSPNPSAPLHITFTSAPLPELLGKYESVSYFWGRPTLNHPLFCTDKATNAFNSGYTNETTLYVTQNLDKGLRRLRLRNEKRKLWVDALCINQQDDEEKAIQIPQMASIFRGAKRVLAWLGPGNQSTIEAVYSLAKLSRWSRSQVHSLKKDHLENKTPFVIARQVQMLLSLPWFSRMWIIQEVVFNLDVTLICGVAEISWLRLCVALEIYQLKTLQQTLARKISAIKRIHELWARHNLPHGFLLQSSSIQNDEEGAGGSRNGDAHGIADLMTEFVHYQCSDERDRIFALFSMASDIYTPLSLRSGQEPSPMMGIPMKIDYTLNVQQTYRSLAKSAMENGQLTNMIQRAAARKLSALEPEWPSWVPDWRLAATTSTPRACFSSTDFELFSVIKDRIVLSMAQCYTLLNSTSVAVTPKQTGARFLQITAKGPVYSTFSSSGRRTEYIPNVSNFHTLHTRRMNHASQSNPSTPDALTGITQMLSLLDVTGNITQSALLQLLDTSMKGRCTFIALLASPMGYIFGVGDEELQEGDELLIGGKKEGADGVLPALILRRTKERAYRIVGDANVASFENVPVETGLTFAPVTFSLV